MYPITLKVRGQKAVVVGGGPVAERKAAALVEAGAKVTVVAPEVCPALERRISGGECQHRWGNYEAHDLEGALLVIGATGDAEVNAQVAADARAAGILVNIVDQPHLCTFFVPASVCRGDLTIAVSTAGKSPALARKLREELEALYGPGYAAFLNLLGDLRPQVRARIEDQQARRAVWEDILASDALGLMAEGEPEQARQVAEKIIRRAEESRRPTGPASSRTSS
ncbi:MAG: bifunctional precorrin-2 dehydrogenase/sirohydrochlorin ferrochelatase [Armatimonadota bacterium]